MSCKLICKYDESIFDGLLDVMEEEHESKPIGVLSQVKKINIIRQDGTTFDHSKLYMEYVEKAKELLREYFGDGECPLAILLTIPSGCLVEPHRDKGETNRTAIRCHFPVVTNDGVVMDIGSEKIQMRAGEMWYVDTFNALHGTINNGSESRTHLIIDWIKVNEKF